MTIPETPPEARLPDDVYENYGTRAELADAATDKAYHVGYAAGVAETEAKVSELITVVEKLNVVQDAFHEVSGSLADERAATEALVAAVVELYKITTRHRNFCLHCAGIFTGDDAVEHLPTCPLLIAETALTNWRKRHA